MPVSSSPLVHKANQASSNQIFEACKGLEARHAFRTLLASELKEVDRKNVWTIIEGNMRELYTASSFGWDPSGKHLELFSSLSRFILIDIDGKLAGFVMFRFECENEQDIIYCYELQIQKTYQRFGLGRFLIQVLEAIGRAWHMKKLVLTVFKSNLTALNFYRVSGFSMDETSPGYSEGEDDDTDYIILSKQTHE